MGGPFIADFVRLLKESPRFIVRLVGLDASPTAVGRHFVDAFHLVSRGDEAGYAEQVLDLAKREAADIVIAWSDEEVLALASRRSEFAGAGVTLTCPEPDTARCLTDKVATYVQVETKSVRVPPYRLLNRLDDVGAAARELGYPTIPLVLKPVRSRGGRGVYVLDEHVDGIEPLGSGRVLRARLSWLEKLDVALAAPALLMPFFTGPFYDVDSLCCSGKPIQLVPRRRYNPHANPFSGGVIEAGPGLLDVSARVCGALNLTYLYDLEFAYSADNEPMLLEVNPRPSGSVAGVVAAGVPLLDDLITLCLEGEAESRPVPYGRAIEPYGRLFVSQSTK